METEKILKNWFYFIFNFLYETPPALKFVNILGSDLCQNLIFKKSFEGFDIVGKSSAEREIFFHLKI
jgi:hypothetical protein